MALKDLTIKSVRAQNAAPVKEAEKGFSEQSTPNNKMALHKEQALKQRYNNLIENLNECWRDGKAVTEPLVTEMVGIYHNLRQSGVEISRDEKWGGFAV